MKTLANSRAFRFGTLLLVCIISFSSCRLGKGNFNRQKYTQLKSPKTTVETEVETYEASEMVDVIEPVLTEATESIKSDAAIVSEISEINNTLEEEQINTESNTPVIIAETDSKNIKTTTYTLQETVETQPLQVRKEPNPSKPDGKIRALGSSSIGLGYILCAVCVYAGIVAASTYAGAILIGFAAIGFFILGAYLLKKAYGKVDGDGQWRKKRKNGLMYIMFSTVIAGLGLLLAIFTWSQIIFLIFMIGALTVFGIGVFKIIKAFTEKRAIKKRPQISNT